MKIGTVPRITVGVIAVIALAFIGSRQLLSPEEDSSPSAEVTSSKPLQAEQSASVTDTKRRNVVTAPRRADEAQISAEEMGEIENFFAQLDEVDTRLDTEQLATTESQQVTDEHVVNNTEGFAENAEQSAEDVMNAYVEAFKDYDLETMYPLMTADMRDRWDSAPKGFKAEIGTVRRETADGTVMVEDSGMVEEARLQLERLMFEPMLKMMSRAAVVDSGYVDDEFHFRLSVPPPDPPISNGVAVIEGSIPPPPDTLIKMQIEDSAWRIYDSETLD